MLSKKISAPLLLQEATSHGAQAVGVALTRRLSRASSGYKEDEAPCEGAVT